MLPELVIFVVTPWAATPFQLPELPMAEIQPELSSVRSPPVQIAAEAPEIVPELTIVAPTVVKPLKTV